ncbi:hypothetical protein OCGS_1184 [Oceaniovalibus guishaninsula JLT2003]|uniref:Lysophospholipase L1 and related esterase-like protein n=1 Tax=Oceaniovalibus guishaninsula JLT2003 TaxID=1231392 RepID=K2GQ59_9RHOB|nr:DUF1489 family protein [Oceaniovalibus guishaninsula]EKE44801.1 hypothetical protein OCGS_1184 [Oceaniovalibus guishaninsula JLT2003]
MDAKLHLLKLSVGSESVEGLIDWQRNRSEQRIGGRYYHLTRMWPRRQAELLAGGSIFWVIQGLILARQRVLSLHEVTGQDGIRRCGLVLDAEVVRTEPVARRPFQGWRYLEAADAPADLGGARGGDADLPPSLMAALAEIGVR